MVRIISFQFLFALLSLILFQIHATSLSSVDQLPVSKPNQAASTCSYTVRITTSCSSVKHTRDQISLSFGDGYGNQVYVPKISNPSSRAFEACSTDKFDIKGPCTHNVCYVYLYRKGHDGWTPGSVRISGPYIRTVEFNYNRKIPSDTWYGPNRCSGAFAYPNM